MINNKVTKIVLQNVEQKIAQGKFTPQNNLAQVEGIIISAVKLQELREGQPYY